MNSQALKPAVDENQILSSLHREILSEPAQKLFVAIWFKVHNTGRTTIWMADAEASRCARVLIELIPGAQIELARAGFVHMSPGERQTSYELIDRAEIL